MPKEAKIFMAEDVEPIRRPIIELLNYFGHSVLLEASSFFEAMEKVKEAKELGINVAILDGSLDRSGYSPDDGLRIAEALRKEIPDIKIVSFSGSQIPQTWGDVNLGKDVKTRKLNEIIINL